MRNALPFRKKQFHNLTICGSGKQYEYKVINHGVVMYSNEITSNAYYQLIQTINDNLLASLIHQVDSFQRSFRIDNLINISTQNPPLANLLLLAFALDILLPNTTLLHLNSSERHLL